MERWISARTGVAVPFDQAVALLMSDAQHVLDADAEPTGPARIELSVESIGGTAVRQSVEVSFGAPCSAEGEAWIPISWEPMAHSHLLPSFGGVIEVVEAEGGPELVITGTYGVPLGALGRFGDVVLGQRIARQSLRGLLEAMAERLAERADATRIP